MTLYKSSKDHTRKKLKTEGQEHGTSPSLSTVTFADGEDGMNQ